jgi:hypothetical protein
MYTSKIIDELGGPTRVAKDYGITPQAVSQWRKYGIPKVWLLYFKLLRPELFYEQNVDAK